MSLRCAIIGCGPSTPGKGGAHSIAYAHGWAIRRLKELELVAACSRTGRNLEDFQREFPGCQGYRDYRQMLQEIKPDLVSVCAWPPEREEMVLAAIAAGAKAVWIEKPLAAELGAARRTMAAAHQAGCRLFVNHQRRYGQPFVWWREAVQERKIGDLIGIDIAQPFSCVMEFGPHLVDAALYALGPQRQPTHVLAATDRSLAEEHHGLPVEQQLMATIHFNDGTRLTLEAGARACSKVPLLRAHGTLGFAELRLEALPGDGAVFRALYPGQPLVSPATSEHIHHSEDGVLYIHRALMDMVEALHTGATTRIDASEAVRSLEILMGAFESARLRRMLSFPITQDRFPPSLAQP